MKHQKWSVFLCTLLAVTVLFGITAEDSYEDVFCEFCINIIEEHLLDHHMQ